MFIVLLKFSANKSQAGQHMEAHKAWIKRGFDEGVFLMAGSLQLALGGGILAHNTNLAALQARVDEDPFVIEDIVSAEIIEITPSRIDPRLEFVAQVA
ncbi:YciI family protein [Cellvibrio sp. ARAG 10.3]|uniref:YciI family protein n=1 Tax=Cellvibrio sp. ARAG 10.3 TaxID=3451358 RepID=UPI003F47E83E